MADEVTRRLVHASTTAVPVTYLLVEAVTWRHVQVFLAGALLAAFALEVVRLYVGLDWRIFEKLTREYEQNNLAGYFLGAVGMTTVALAFPPTSDAVIGLASPSNVAVPAILMLTIADPVSGLLGSGELRTAKQVWVLLATFGVATLLALPFVPSAAAVAGGVAATVADGLKPVVRGHVIDDNLTIPIAAAVAMFLVVDALPSVAG